MSDYKVEYFKLMKNFKFACKGKIFSLHQGFP